jgi:hypothetical protein
MASKRYKPRGSSPSCGRSMFGSSQVYNMVNAIRQIGVSEVTYSRRRHESGRGGKTRIRY